ncbi:glycine cleavage system aminomethyltransferase GcvT [Haloplanus aerogenes]|uniref:Probable aminomethyltransferase n=1 Tax=Haloplanus aerogenes TaxID=660522 RepID=A0A3G8QY84_9EURY|nr:glycine cleavage system aminomethyltransferase GcvT [Haloplanus aerogenes]AZH26462.1 glycine cleavage system aminomethyltransferase GcvT [Haloplanus aerogenes]RMB18070.1 aminomethyltransferase [Haloplanus aerogenes]
MGLRKPPLHAIHADRDASFTEFGGWEMPVEFDSIRTEHAAVRESAGLFDVSHMGEIRVSGPDAAELMGRLTTNDVAELDPGDTQYACITDDEGIILDDTVVFRLADADGVPQYLFIPNAGHDTEMYTRWIEYRDEWDLDATVHNATEEWAMLALQGPDAPDLAAAATDGASRDIARFDAAFLDVAGVRCFTSRTGYTGEDGFEFLVPWDEAETVWSAFDCQPCGLGARDTLRLEMGFLLSGQDFDPEDEPRTPYEAGVGWTVDLDTEFVGRDALERVESEGVDERFRGVVLQQRGVPRHGYEVVDADGEHLGHLTSGTMSPTLGEPIGLGYLSTEQAPPGTRVRVLVRGEPKQANVVTPPFIDK